MFKGRKLVIATQHKKEQVIAPILEKEIGVTCFTNTLFNTDSLGTFSGEIERKSSALDTLRAKCIQTAKLHQCDLAIGSEGSFGMHPTLFFSAADEEFLMLLDLKNNLEIVTKELSTATNFGGETISNLQELLAFAEKSCFPSHALILKSSEKNPTFIYKGIQSEKDLINKFEYLKKNFSKVHVETDMRAHMNPSRMQIIKKATQQLISKIQSCCPSCDTPGFDIILAKPGLRCSSCNLPTKSTLSWIYQCKKCAFEKESFFPYQKELEDPMFCDYCNP